MNNQPTIDVKVKVHENGTMPIRSRKGDAAFDLYAAEDAQLYRENGVYSINTDIAVGLPKNYFGYVTGRSGMTFKCNVHTHQGVIDPNYTGKIAVALSYHGSEGYYEIKKGDRIAQMLILPIPQVQLSEVQCLDMNTERNCAGFGSSGK